MRIFQLLFAAPVPVGHQVELIWYRRHAFTGFSVEPISQPHEPFLRDLDDGVIHAPYWMYLDGPVRSTDRPAPFLNEVRADLQREFRLTGRVLACRVISLRSATQTVLHVEPDEDRGVYR